MATAIIHPQVLIVFLVIHHTQDVNNSSRIIYSPDPSEPIVAAVENEAVPNLIRRTERLFYGREVSPRGSLGELVPGLQIPLRDSRIVFSRFPKFSQLPLGDNSHATPIGGEPTPRQ